MELGNPVSKRILVALLQNWVQDVKIF